MSQKKDRLAALVRHCHGNGVDAHYLAFFECFNQQRFFEAHEVLEESWLSQRGGSRDLFYKGLIQLAGAFVHLQKHRGQPAAALLQLARHNLCGYRPMYERLDIEALLERVDGWLHLLRQGRQDELLRPAQMLKLLPG